MRKPDNMSSGKRTSQATGEDTPPNTQQPPSPPPPSDQAPLRRRKKTSYFTDNHGDDIMDTDEDDGDQADAEYGGLGDETSWVGVSERRRRSGQINKSRIVEEVRRHSLAV
jgi:hypothetical protein